MSKSALRIGLSSCFLHPDLERNVFKGKTLNYLVKAMADWLMAEGAIPCLIPPPGGTIKLKTLLSTVDGLILQGGSDVAPESYGDIPLQEDWAGDVIRDNYEIKLVQAALAQRKPLLGICRGVQLINVALGGTLYQDIESQVTEARLHKDHHLYDQLFHKVRFTKHSLLNKIYPGKQEGIVNSVHHQAIKELGKDLKIEALSDPDGVIEAIRYVSRKNLFAYGVQWHPEFQDHSDRRLLPSKPLLRMFFHEIGRRKE